MTAVIESLSVAGDDHGRRATPVCLAELATASDKARRDAPAIAVCEV